jgi:hypothetical protein
MSRQAYWIAALIFAALVGAKFSPQSGFASLIRFGDTWRDRRHSSLQNLPLASVPNSNGYDGQFYAQLALDPSLRDPELKRIIDAPGYRARRILLPVSAAVLGFGRPWWTLQVYALLNVACWFALAWLLRREIGAGDWAGFARWSGCMFSLGVLDSVRQSLVDLPALLLLTMAVRTFSPANLTRSTCWLALGNLARETNLLGALALHAENLAGSKNRARSAFFFLLAALPLALWSVYVRHRFDDPAASPAGNFTWPVVGALEQIQISFHEISAGKADSRYVFSLVAVVGFAVQCGLFWRSPLPTSPWWRIGAAYSVLLLFLGPLVWSGYWAACRAVLPMTIAFNLLLPAGRRFWPLWIVGNLSLLHGVWRFL